MGFRRRVRRRALVGGAIAGGAIAHHRATSAAEEQQGYDQAPAEQQAPAEEPEQAAYAPPPADPADEIEHLAQLHSSGALTDEEFAAAKAKTLGNLKRSTDCQKDVQQIDNREDREPAMSQSRKDVLLKALEAEVGGASVDLGTLFTDDVVGWSPYAIVSGLEALAELAALREEAFSNVVIMVRGLDEVGNKAFAEWMIEADHTGPLVLDDDAVLQATGRHVQLPGVSVADFRNGKIRTASGTYFDDLSLIEQIAGG